MPSSRARMPLRPAVGHRPVAVDGEDELLVLGADAEFRLRLAARLEPRDQFVARVDRRHVDLVAGHSGVPAEKGRDLNHGPGERAIGRGRRSGMRYRGHCFGKRSWLRHCARLGQPPHTVRIHSIASHLAHPRPNPENDPMKLYYMPGACSLAPHIALREAGLPFDLEKVDGASKKTSAGEDFMAINPKGAVPAIKLDDGQVLTEGAAIQQYIADKAPAKKLAPAAGTMRALPPAGDAQLHRERGAQGHRPALQQGDAGRLQGEREEGAGGRSSSRSSKRRWPARIT